MFGNGVSLADVAAVTRNNEDGFNNGWWILILLWAINGGNGFGNNRQNDTNAIDASLQRGFDTQSIISKLDGINSGLCNLGYDQLNQMNGINQNIFQTGSSLQNAITQLGYQQQNCCCENRQAIAQVRYDMATDTCAITTAINQAAQNIMQNDNNNYRQLHDEQVAMQIQAMRDQLAQKDQLITMLNLKSSQDNQTSDIISGVINQLRDCPVGTYNVCNPNAQTQCSCQYN